MIEKGRTGTWYWLYEKVVRPRSYGSRKRESRVGKSEVIFITYFMTCIYLEDSTKK